MNLYEAVVSYRSTDAPWERKEIGSDAKYDDWQAMQVLLQNFAGVGQEDGFVIFDITVPLQYQYFYIVQITVWMTKTGMGI